MCEKCNEWVRTLTEADLDELTLRVLHLGGAGVAGIQRYAGEPREQTDALYASAGLMAAAKNLVEGFPAELLELRDRLAERAVRRFEAERAKAAAGTRS